MKICFLELMPVPYTVGGGTSILIGLSEELARQGHEVHIITSKPGNNQPKLKIDQRIKIHQVGIPHKTFQKSGILKLPFQLSRRALFEISFVLGGMKALRKIRPEICNPQSLITSSLPCSLTRTPFIASLQGPYLKGFRKLWQDRGSKAALLGSYFYAAFERFNARKAKLLIGTGKETQDYYKKYNRTLIIPNGVDTTHFKRKTSPRKKVLVSVGRLTEQKQIDRLIKSMDFLKDYHLYVGGLGPLEPEIKKLCAERKNCTFLGYQSPDQLPALFNKARFAVFPSAFEGLPLTMLEEMSCGVVPISTPVGDIADLIKDGKNGFILRSTEPKKIAETIRKAEKQNFKKLSDASLQTVLKEYSWKSVAEQFVKAYKLALKKTH